MALSFIAKADQVSAGSGTQVFNYPAGFATGDLIIATVVDNAVPTMNSPGWTQANNFGVGQGRPGYTWWKIIGAETSVSITYNGGARFSPGFEVYRGLAAVPIIGQAEASATTDGMGHFTTPAVTASDGSTGGNNTWTSSFLNGAGVGCNVLALKGSAGDNLYVTILTNWTNAGAQTYTPPGSPVFTNRTFDTNIGGFGQDFLASDAQPNTPPILVTESTGGINASATAGTVV